MKKFSNLNELWDYCSECLVCKSDRKVQLSIGPDTDIKLVKYKKYNNILNISFNHIEYEDDYLSPEDVDDYLKTKIKDNNFILQIDCSKNTTSLVSEDQIFIHSLMNDIDNIYFYLFAECKKCESYINTSDIICLKNKNIESDSISIETEGFYILKDNKGFYIFVDHKDSTYGSGAMRINNVIKNIDLNTSITHKNVCLKLPILDWNYSNPSEVINKINNILSFK